MKWLSIPVGIVVLTTCGLRAEQSTFYHVKIHRHRSAEQRVLVDKVGKLTFDDSSRKIRFESRAGDHIDVGYDYVKKVVFDVTTHAHETAVTEIVKGTGIPGFMLGSAVANQHVSDYWLFLDYRGDKGDERALLEVPKDSSTEVIDKAQTIFGSRVVVKDFAEKGATIRIGDLKALKSRQALKIDRKNRPMLEMKPDKATVVVVCPPLAARNAGFGNQFKLHANDEVVAVNKTGTYSFAYLDPGKYRLISQTENANGFEMNLESGHDYYFVQSTFQGAIKAETGLSRNSREVVMYLVDGSYFADWKPKEK
jgi:hypothetical protein